MDRRARVRGRLRRPPAARGGPAYALDSHRGITQYAQTRFEAQDGLAHNLVNSMAQTPDGYLWAGSEEGVNRYDGFAFKVFDHRNTDAIPSNAFFALAVDRAGGLWAGFRDHGVVRLQGGEFRPVLWAPDAGDAQVRSMAFDRDGDLWVGLRGNGMVRLRNGALVGHVTSRDGCPATRSARSWSRAMARCGSARSAVSRTGAPGTSAAAGRPRGRGSRLGRRGSGRRSVVRDCQRPGRVHGDTVDWSAVIACEHAGSSAAARFATATCGSAPAAASRG